MGEKPYKRGITPRARIFDWLAGRCISIGGIGIIAAVMGIFFFVLSEAWPLFRSPEVTAEKSRQVVGPFAIGLDPYYQTAYAVGPQGVDLLRLDNGQVISRERPTELTGREVTAAQRTSNDVLALGTADGHLLLAQVRFQLDYSSGQRQVVPQFAVKSLVAVDPAGESLVQVAFREGDDGRSAAAAITASGRLVVIGAEQQQGLLGPGERREKQYELTADFDGKATQVLLDGRIRQVLVGTDQGRVYEWRLGAVEQAPAFVGHITVSEVAVSALGYALGEVSLIVGDAAGHVSTWFKVEENGQRSYRKIHTFAPHAAAVTHIDASARDKQFLTADAEGAIALHHLTSEHTAFQMRGDSPATALVFAPKADGFLALGQDGGLRRFALDHPHPEISAAVLFAPIWYEGYGGREYVWQSTGGTDEFEPKLSLVPLILGTAKGTFYALLFALPLAVLAAIYTAEFASPRVQALVKPSVEVMASLPSVILGFLAGLWLAPLLESHLLGTLLLLPAVPTVVIAAAWGWQYAPDAWVRQVARVGEIYLLGAVTLLVAWLAYALGPVFEDLAFDGHFLRWLRQDAGVGYDQRNCLVVGFVMGFAVVPLIFTICEDALSSVPRHLRAGSLALGATPWQTAIKVVLPMALPGIFSAAMIGLGRAIGETMIVLMATGNTPIMDWNIFNGMRTISANIAVELPEAPHQGTLYRVLFLSGLLLFMATFFINSLAEVVRQRLRDKYNRL
ncbi:MAG: ABC transporter permease subunit [Gemmatimonadetes bacterium]|nr:ABC transporter permease subunit [Gemmatimonadota bacterium]MYC70978.1 ABC transporter permease subunit [Gemmatimonadota bacterium]MYI62340.1 ABC transporter permease subunit [Gemmatimonadota bacterium]